MASRMEKYYKENAKKSRSVKNTDLYDTIYDYGEYSNIEGIATIEKTNEIDIRKIKEMLNKREQKPEVRKKYTHEYKEMDVEKKDDRSYDIREILNQAKDEKVDDDKYRSLRNTNYDIFRNLKVEEKNEKDEPDLKELINTITNTSMLNKLDNKELSLNILQELSSDKTTEQTATIKALIKELEADLADSDEEKVDNSFYTSSLGFKKEDFEDIEGHTHKSKKKGIIVAIVVIVLLVVLGILFFVLK